jgi:hypothetical protein
MATSAYDEALRAAQRLDPAERLRLVEELVGLARRQLTAPQRRSIRELRGLGKEAWDGVDAQAYVDDERDSWGG